MRRAEEPRERRAGRTARGLAALAVVVLWAGGLNADARAAAPSAPSAPSAPEASSAPVHLELAVGGGAVLPWAAASELGHAFYGSVGVAWGPWRAAVAAGGAAPDSMARATFPAVWAELSWEALGRLGPIAPYALVGAGVALGDGLSDPRPGEVRWSHGGAQPLFMLGVGAAFRPTERGLFLAVDARLFNHTHGGLTLSAGARF